MHRHRNRRIMTPQATRMEFVEASLSHFSATSATDSLNVLGISSVVMKKNKKCAVHLYTLLPKRSSRFKETVVRFMVLFVRSIKASNTLSVVNRNVQFIYIQCTYLNAPLGSKRLL